MKKFLFILVFTTVLNNYSEEQRAFIPNLTQVKTKLEVLHAQYKGNYSFTDHIYFPKDSQAQASYARIRIYKKSEWIHKKVVLTIKDDKQNVLLKNEYDTLEEAQKHILPEFKYLFNFSREGWEYALNGCALFLEKIEHLQLSLEIVAPTEQEISTLFKTFSATKILEESLPLYYAKLACTAHLTKN